MFETSVVRERTAAVKGRAGLLSASLVAHTVAVFGVVAVSIASVDFPKSAPNQFAPFEHVDLVAVPPPLGDPNGGAKPAPKPAATPAAAPAPVPNQPTAPTTVPDTVTPAAASSSSVAENDGPPGATSTAPRGMPWGDPNSVSTDLDVPPGIVAAPTPVEEKIYTVTGEVRAPVVIRRVEPRFPPVLARTRMSATIRVRCIIDKQGNVQNPEVLVSSLPPFNESVVAAVKQWKFSPATLRGQAVDAWFELTVNFSVR